MRRYILGLVAIGMIGLGASVTLRSDTQAAICNQAVPLGAIPPAVPEWCQSLVAGLDTHIEGGNSWVDDFDHGQTHATLNGSYAQGTFGDIADVLHWQHNNHWMVDLQGQETQESWGPYRVKGGSWMRPNRTFAAEAGKLVVETEIAGPIATYESPLLSDFWPEVVVTTAPGPVPGRADALYLYDEFANHWTFGCRLNDSYPICALFDNSSRGPGQGGRVYEISFFQCAGASCFGGGPFAELASVWKSCSNVDDPDAICRNKFRLELTSTNVLLYVNGVRYFQQTGLPPGLGSLLSQPMYVYQGDVAHQFGNGVLRVHWDHFAVNPGSVAPTPTNMPLPTNTPAPTNTPTVTPPATPTATATPRTYRCQVRNANGSWTTVWSRPGGGSCP